ncbi:hypothetical protein [Microbispora sp. NPDC049125]|uniref:hypothetical protein n=1 Tax=Microbispora sp. NPDC049125 TaxID=3154929 RepID=UPI00346764F2
MDELTIQIPALVVELDPAEAEAVAAGRLDALRGAVVSALRDHPAVARFLPPLAGPVASRTGRSL